MRRRKTLQVDTVYAWKAQGLKGLEIRNSIVSRLKARDQGFNGPETTGQESTVPLQAPG